MKLHCFTWHSFHDWAVKEKILPAGEWGNVNWANRLQQAEDRQNFPSYAVRFLVLAYLDSVSEEQPKGSVRTYLNNLLKRKNLHFTYDCFYAHKGELCQELAKFFAVSLLQHQNGNFQYIRTLQKISGTMYIRFAEEIGNQIRTHGLLFLNNEQVLESVIGDIFESYRASDDEFTVSDIASFFHTLIERYLLKNSIITVEDITALHPLTEAVAAKIISLMAIQQEELETSPQVGVDESGNGIFVFPDIGNFPNVQGRSVTFLLKKDRNGDPVSWVKYIRLNGVWNKRSGGQDFSLRNIRSIIRKEEGSTDECESIPAQCLDEEYLLVKVDRNRQCTILLPGTKLQNNCDFMVLPLGDNSPTIQILKDGELNNFDGRCFSPSKAEPGSEALFITDSDGHQICYWFATAVQWLSQDTQNDWIRKPGSRQFYAVEMGDLPVSDQCLSETSEIRYYPGNDRDRYIKLYGNTQIIQNHEQWQQCLCQRGWLEYRPDNGKIFRRAVTFLPDISWGIDENTPLNYGETRAIDIHISGEAKPIHYDIDGSAAWIEFNYREFEFCYKIPRCGVRFIYNRTIIPLASNHITQISKEDFECLKCEIRQPVSNMGNVCFFTKGNQFKAITSTTIKTVKFGKFLGTRGNETLNHTDNPYCSIVMIQQNDSLSCYKFHIYDPIREKQVNGSFVSSERNGDDLSLSFYLPLCRSEKKEVSGIHSCPPTGFGNLSGQYCRQLRRSF